ncbi:TrmB family transcriptional regulator [Oceanivirga salmonicida]|uniref:TrmB family transcriptional regulator n=1 Tax=Oceanivirga salmonicida TaxID=1769291 RepID=UPI00082E44C3|nr:helix-turn-helix domain-containing protein [Oceanivirga salmonicida]
MDIVEKLKKVGFTDGMALVYIELLKKPGLNGTQIFKNLNLPRTSVYNALEQLEQDGIISLIPTESDKKNYNPIPPHDIVKNIKNMYSDILSSIGVELESIYKPESFSEVYNITGIENIYYKINDMIEIAKEKIVISGDIDENRLILNTNLNIGRKNETNEEEMYIIIDDKEVLVARLNENYAVGIYTKNSIIISRYI